MQDHYLEVKQALNNLYPEYIKLSSTKENQLRLQEHFKNNYIYVCNQIGVVEEIVMTRQRLKDSLKKSTASRHLQKKKALLKETLIKQPQ